MMGKPLLKSRGLYSVKSLLRRSTPLFAANPQFSNGLIDLSVEPLKLFEEQRSQKHAASYLNTVAATGLFSVETLDQFYDILSSADLCKHKHLLYYLASLYLQVGESDKVTQLLMSTGAASAEMSWFAALMLYARSNGFEIPVQNATDHNCLDFLEKRLKDPVSVIHEALGFEGSVAIIGNAPGPNSEFNADDHKTICFNDYQKNQRLTGKPEFHVITPSWDIGQSAGEPRLFITGNNIFHRRSRVWRRFGHSPEYQSVSCFPKALWSRLYLLLEAPPSAGLLMISCLAETELPEAVSVLVAGFSEKPSEVNHSYDQVPASTRHNWSGEYAQRKAALDLLNDKVKSVHCLA